MPLICARVSCMTFSATEALMTAGLVAIILAVGGVIYLARRR